MKTFSLPLLIDFRGFTAEKDREWWQIVDRPFMYLFFSLIFFLMLLINLLIVFKHD